MHFPPCTFERGLTFLLRLQHVGERAFQVSGKHHVFCFDSEDIDANLGRLRLHTRQKLRADFQSLVEQRFHSDAAYDRTQSKLSGIVEIAQPVLRFVCGLDWLRHLVSDEQAQFEANIVSRRTS